MNFTLWRSFSFSLTGQSVVIFMLFYVLLLVSRPLLATSDDLQQGFQFYENKQYENALEAYQTVTESTPEAEQYEMALMGAGSSAYRLKESGLAIESFKQVAKVAATDQIRAQALFNLGNAYMQAQIANYAVEAYQQALIYQPEFPDAKYNLAIAMQQKLAQQPQQRGQSGRGEKGQTGQGQGAGEREGKLDLGQNFIGGAGQKQDEGGSPDEQVQLPESQNRTQFDLHSKTSELQVNSAGQATEGVHQQTVNKLKAEKFLMELETKDFNQQLLLKRLMEREEGFFADQKTAHEIPGVDPW
ncbi:tetratricopeptide repeat protein [Thiomicrorhabdus indica]|uniref:tetratricopeptide repeat protein n=1 Tax=Thiomicrorhabdus indica TaxID=2267253 RepID=UPI002AA922D3|nr:tetratricopeptide repeat protein [Thiomicrorhabdus indica]